MKKKLNVLWLMSDQHNANCTGYAGNPDVKTPNLDTIAANGVQFTHGYCNNPICSPSRVCFITGQYMRTNRMYSNGHAELQDSNSNTLSALFRRYGYQTALIGKSHMIRKWDDEGFEHIRYTDLCDSKSNFPETCHYFKYLIDLGLADQYEEGSPKPGQTGDGSTAASLPYEHSIEHYTGEETLKFLKNRDEARPFFIHMSFQRPHDPVTPAAENFDLYNPDEITLPDSKVDWLENQFEGKCAPIVKVVRNNSTYPLAQDEKRLRRAVASYYSLITSIDSEIGRVLDYLKEKGELENTVVFYTADHGDFAGEHGLHFKNLGIYESIHRIPYLLWYPGCEKGRVDDSLVESVDLYRTICNLCGVPVSEHVDGVDLQDVIRGDVDKDAVYCEWEWGASCEKISAIRTKTARLFYYAKANTGELYDLTQDPGEINNLWDSPDYATLKAELILKLLSFTMQGSEKTHIAFSNELHEPGPYMFSDLIQKRGAYYSTLEKAFRGKEPWPKQG